MIRKVIGSRRDVLAVAITRVISVVSIMDPYVTRASPVDAPKYL